MNDRILIDWAMGARPQRVVRGTPHRVRLLLLLLQYQRLGIFPYPGEMRR